MNLSVKRFNETYITIVDENGSEISLVWSRHVDSEATARLFAAAPELLDALEFLYGITEQPPHKNCSCHINPPCNDCVDYGALREALEDSKKAIAKAKVE